MTSRRNLLCQELEESHNSQRGEEMYSVFQEDLSVLKEQRGREHGWPSASKGNIVGDDVTKLHITWDIFSRH